MFNIAINPKGSCSICCSLFQYWIQCLYIADTSADPAALGCQNGGKCKEGGCICPEGTSGEFCEIVGKLAVSNTRR